MSNLKKLHDLTVEVEIIDHEIEDLNRIAEIVASSENRSITVGLKIDPDEEQLRELKKNAVGGIEVIQVDVKDGMPNMGEAINKAMKIKEEFEDKMDELCPQVAINLKENEAFKIIEVMMNNLKTKRAELIEKINEIKVK